MKPSRVTVRYGVTKNMGNYESLRLDYEMTITLELGDKYLDALTNARVSLREDVNEAITREIEFLDRPPRRRG